MEQRWKAVDRGKPKDSEKRLSATLSTTNPTWTDPGLRVMKTATKNRLSYGTASTILLVLDVSREALLCSQLGVLGI
jgi:hypothetical protein